MTRIPADWILKKMRRASESHSHSRGGMIVGMPKVTMDKSHLDVAIKSIESLIARTKALETGLEAAIEDIQSWGEYASPYFQDKHDLKGCIAGHRKLLAQDKER